MRRVPKRAAALAALCLLAGAASARAYCPSYTRASSGNTHHCAVDAALGINPTREEWSQLFERIAWGPSAWGDQGPAIADIGKGCGTATKVPATFPCELLKSLGWKESSWQQFCKPAKPNDQAGKPSQTIISFDCGYGVMQVTSGMRDTDARAAFDRKRVASDSFYSAATGAAILARKWGATRCVGVRDPAIIEHWYYAVWAYNGLSFSNHPANPTFDSERGVYDPALGGDYPYQEKVFGLMEHPPRDRWPAIELAYPRVEDIGDINKNALPEPSCASPTDCTHHRATHRTTCSPAPARSPVGDETPTGESPTTPAGTATSTSEGSTTAGGTGTSTGEVPFQNATGNTAAGTPGGTESKDAKGCDSSAVGLSAAFALSLVVVGIAAFLLGARRRRQR